MATLIAPPPATTARNPICRMALDPAQAVARRAAGVETLYFGANTCVGQWDQDPAASVSTGVPTTAELGGIARPLTLRDGRQATDHRAEQLTAWPGGRQATVTADAKRARITDAPTAPDVAPIMGRARAVGYTIRAATTQRGIAACPWRWGCATRSRGGCSAPSWSRWRWPRVR